jgi:hypothetical protein
LNKINNLFLFFFLLFTFFIYTNSPVSNQNDSLWNSFTTYSLIKEQNFDLNEFEYLFTKTFYANLYTVGDRYYNYYPYGISILSIPFVYSYDLFFKLKGKNVLEELEKHAIKIDKFVSTCFILITSVLMFQIGKILELDLKRIYLSLFIFLFATVNFSVLSRGLWQHTALSLLYTLVIYLYLKNQFVLLSIPLYFSYLVRPTSLVFILFLSIICIFKLKKKSYLFILLSTFVIILFISINQINFKNWNHPYYDFNKVSDSNTFLEALAGNLISPSRGILVYSSFFVFSIWGILFKKKKLGLNFFDYNLLLGIILHFYFISKNSNWWGGHCFGYRLSSDILPFLFFYLLYYIKFLDMETINSKIFLVLVLLSVMIHTRGAYHWETYFWNLKPNNIDENPSRNWNYKDFPFLRN